MDLPLNVRRGKGVAVAMLEELSAVPRGPNRREKSYALGWTPSETVVPLGARCLGLTRRDQIKNAFERPMGQR